MRLVWVILFLPTVAWALPAVRISVGACPVSKVDFVPAAEGLRSLGLPLAMMSTALELRVESESLGASECSASLVSDSGNALTAGHCFANCLGGKDVYRNSTLGLVVDHDRLAQVRCDVRVNGKPQSARILALNDCPPSEYDKAKLPENCHGLDYALVQFDPPLNQGGKCLKVNPRKISPGTSVAGIHFPGVESKRHYLRSDARDTLGDALSVNAGEVVTPSGTCIKKIDPQPHGGERSGSVAFRDTQVTERLKQFSRDGDILQTSVDFLRKSSGGSLIDREGALVGLARDYRSQNHNEFIECAGATYFTSASSVIADVKRKYPDLDLGRQLTCDRNSALGAVSF